MHEIYEDSTPNSFFFFSLVSQIDDPLTYEEVVEEYGRAQAMDLEIECIEKDHTWEVVDLLEDKDVISVKWIYETKQDDDGNVQKQKERMIIRGFTQQLDIEFNETFACVAHMDIVKTVPAIDV